MSKKILKTITLLVVFLFTMQSVVWANPDFVYKVNVPEKYGSVTQRYKASVPSQVKSKKEKVKSVGANPCIRPESNNPQSTNHHQLSNKTVILIQDAHSSLEAQKNISEIIRSVVNDLQGKRKNLPATEGSGNAKLQAVEERKSPEVTPYSITTFPPSRGNDQGVEESLATILRQSDDKERETSNTNHPSLCTMLVSVEGAVGDLDLSPLRDFPVKSARDRVAFDYLKEGSFGAAEYSAMTTDVPFVLFGAEEKGLFRDNLKAFYTVAQKRNDIVAYFDALAESIATIKKDVFSSSLYAMDTQIRAYYAGAGDFVTLMETLLSNGDVRKIDLCEYPQIAQCLEMSMPTSRFDMQELVLEVEVFTYHVLLLMAKTHEERALVTVTHELSRLRRVCLLEATKDDTAFLQKNFDPHAIARIHNTVKTISTLNRITIALPDEPSFATDVLFNQVQSFYSAADRRNNVLVSNTITKMDETGQDTALLLAGGYHTEGIAEALRARNVNYVVVKPNVSSDDTVLPYRDKMTGNLFSLSPALTSTITILKAYVNAIQGGDGWNAFLSNGLQEETAQAIHDEVAQTMADGTYTSPQSEFEALKELNENISWETVLKTADAIATSLENTENLPDRGAICEVLQEGDFKKKVQEALATDLKRRQIVMDKNRSFYDRLSFLSGGDQAGEDNVRTPEQVIERNRVDQSTLREVIFLSRLLPVFENCEDTVNQEVAGKTLLALAIKNPKLFMQLNIVERLLSLFRPSVPLTIQDKVAKILGLLTLLPTDPFEEINVVNRLLVLLEENKKYSDAIHFVAISYLLGAIMRAYPDAIKEKEDVVRRLVALLQSNDNGIFLEAVAGALSALADVDDGVYTLKSVVPVQAGILEIDHPWAKSIRDSMQSLDTEQSKGLMIGTMLGVEDLEIERVEKYTIILRRLGIKEKDMATALEVLYCVMTENLNPERIFRVYDPERNNYDLYMKYLKMIAHRYSSFSDEVKRALSDGSLDRLSLHDVVDYLEKVLCDQATFDPSEAITGWSQVRKLLGICHKYPEILQIVGGNIIMTIRFVRQKIRSIMHFRAESAVELINFQLRDLVEKMTATIVSTNDMLSFRRLLRSINLGTSDQVDEMRIAADLLAELVGYEDQFGRQIHFFIHEYNSPLHLAMVQAYIDFIRSDCTDTESRERLEEIMNVTNVFPELIFLFDKNKLLDAAYYLLEKVDAIYGDAALTNIQPHFEEWRASLSYEDDLKEKIAAFLSGDYTQYGFRELQILTDIRRSFYDIIFQKHVSQEALLNTIVLDLRLEVLLHRITGNVTNNNDSSQQVALLDIYLENAAFSGYAYRDMNMLRKEVAYLRAQTPFSSREDWLRYDALLKRVRLTICDIRDQTIDHYAHASERLANVIGVDEKDMDKVRDFSADLFRGETIHLFDLALVEMKNAIKEKVGRSDYEVVADGRSEGRLVFHEDLSRVSEEMGSVIAVVRRVPDDMDIPDTVQGIVLCGGNESILSHPAIQARQRNIPFVVVSEPEIIRGLEGEWVELSASRGGEVSIVPKEPSVITKMSRSSHREPIAIPDMDDTLETIVFNHSEYTPSAVGNKAARMIPSGLSPHQKMLLSRALGANLYRMVLASSANHEIAQLISTLIEGIVADPSGEQADAYRNNIQEAIEDLTISPEIMDEISAELRSAFGKNTRLFFRSSTNAEDLDGYAGAGDYESYGNIPVNRPKIIEKAIKDIWCSVWSKRAFLRREEKGIDHAKVKMGIFIQEMVTPDYSLVIHTKNPLGSDDEVVIEAVCGMGEMLVGGKESGSPFKFIYNRRSKTIALEKCATMRYQYLPDENIAGYFNRELVDYNNVMLDKLIPVLEELAEGCLALEKHFNNVPQDIEASLVLDDASYAIYYLQSRDQIISSSDDAYDGGEQPVMPEEGDDPNHFQLSIPEDSPFYAEEPTIGEVPAEKIYGKDTIARLNKFLETQNVAGLGNGERLEFAGEEFIVLNHDDNPLPKPIVLHVRLYEALRDTFDWQSEGAFLAFLAQALPARGMDADDLEQCPAPAFTFALLDRSQSFFENHTQDGFIGVNRITFDEVAKNENPVVRKSSIEILLSIGFTHELCHEFGEADEEKLTKVDVSLTMKLLVEKQISFDVYVNMLQPLSVKNSPYMVTSRHSFLSLMGTFSFGTVLASDTFSAELLTRHTLPEIAAQASVEFIQAARNRLEQIGAELSVDIIGALLRCHNAITDNRSLEAEVLFAKALYQMLATSFPVLPLDVMDFLRIMHVEMDDGKSGRSVLSNLMIQKLHDSIAESVKELAQALPSGTDVEGMFRDAFSGSTLPLLPIVHKASHEPLPIKLLVTGSSSAEFYDVPKWFPQVKEPYKGGIGGTRMQDDWPRYVEQVMEHAPDVVILYSGDNDVIDDDKSPEDVAEACEKFCNAVHSALPRTHILVMSVKPSPNKERWERKNKIFKINRLLRKKARNLKNVEYVDIVPAMLNRDAGRGKEAPRPELFHEEVADGQSLFLHLNDDGYREVTKIVTPFINDAYRASLRDTQNISAFEKKRQSIVQFAWANRSDYEWAGKLLDEYRSHDSDVMYKKAFSEALDLLGQYGDDEMNNGIAYVRNEVGSVDGVRREERFGVYPAFLSKLFEWQGGALVKNYYAALSAIGVSSVDESLPALQEVSKELLARIRSAQLPEKFKQLNALEVCCSGVINSSYGAIVKDILNSYFVHGFRGFPVRELIDPAMLHLHKDFSYGIFYSDGKFGRDVILGNLERMWTSVMESLDASIAFIEAGKADKIVDNATVAYDAFNAFYRVLEKICSFDIDNYRKGIFLVYSFGPVYNYFYFVRLMAKLKNNSVQDWAKNEIMQLLRVYDDERINAKEKAYNHNLQLRVLAEKTRLLRFEADGRTVTATMKPTSIIGGSYGFALFPTQESRGLFPELCRLDFSMTSDCFVAPTGSFGQIGFNVQQVNGRWALVFDEIQSSGGFREIKPIAKRRLFMGWITAAIQHVIESAKNMGIDDVYVYTAAAMRKRVGRRPEATLRFYYNEPFRNTAEWQRVTIQAKDLWKYVASDVQPEREFSEYESVTISRDTAREAVRMATSYKEKNALKYLSEVMHTNRMFDLVSFKVITGNDVSVRLCAYEEGGLVNVVLPIDLVMYAAYASLSDPECKDFPDLIVELVMQREYLEGVNEELDLFLEKYLLWRAHEKMKSSEYGMYLFEQLLGKNEASVFEDEKKACAPVTLIGRTSDYSVFSRIIRKDPFYAESGLLEKISFEILNDKLYAERIRDLAHGERVANTFVLVPEDAGALAIQDGVNYVYFDPIKHYHAFYSLLSVLLTIANEPNQSKEHVATRLKNMGDFIAKSADGFHFNGKAVAVIAEVANVIVESERNMLVNAAA